MSESVYQHYYTTIYGCHPQPSVVAAAAAYSKLFTAWLPSDKNASIVDFGAGIGLAVRWLRDLGYQRVIGIDCSPEQCQMAQELCGVRVSLIDDGLEFLRRNVNAFDLVLMTDVIEHIPKAQVIPHLEAVRDSLRAAGRLIVKTENAGSPIGAYQYRMDFSHEYCFTEQSLKQVLGVAGFEGMEIRGEPYPLGRRPSSLWRAVVRTTWWWLLRQLYEAERPGLSNPTIFSKSLIASCHKP